MFLDAKKEPEFTQPLRQLLSMLIVLALVGIGSFFLFPTVSPIFLVSPWLNGVILAVFLFGVFICFAQLFTLTSAVSWIEGFALDRPGHEFTKSPRLLASLAALLSDSRARKSLTSNSTRSILDSVATRLDETRDVSRYIVNLLVFLGLLGTFYGLATTVPAVFEIIQSLAPQEGQSSIDVFDNLMGGLGDLMGGMGTAFASSLLGLAGSLIVGLLEIFAGHGQNRFYMELEEWLSSITRIGLAIGDGDGSGADNSAIAGLMEQTSHQIDSLKELVMRGEEQRMRTDSRLGSMTEAISVLAQNLNNQVQGQQSFNPAVFERMAQAQDRMTAGQEQLVSSLSEMAKAQSQDGGIDAETRMHLRNIDVQLLRVLEEMSAGRQDSISEIRQDLATLIYTLQQAIIQDKG